MVGRAPTAVFSSTALDSAGDYTLYMRVTDNSPARVVTERTIRFTIR
jgi:hypothetical protein